METLQLLQNPKEHTVQAIGTVRLPESVGECSSDDLATNLRPLYTQFFEDLNLTQPFERFESEKLMYAVLESAQSTGVPFDTNSHSYQSLMVGYSYADVRLT